MIKRLKLRLHPIICFLLLLTVNSASGLGIDTPLIKAGSAKLAGTITMPNGIKDSTYINISVPHPISGEHTRHKVLVDQLGKFSINVDIETNYTLVGLNTSINLYKTLLVKLINGSTTNIDITYNLDNSIKEIEVTPNTNKNDVLEGIGLIGKMIEFIPDRAPKVLHDKSTDDFLNHAKTSISERLTILDNGPSISKELKEILSKDFRLFMYSGHVFDYEGAMMHNYRNTGDKNKTPEIKKIDKSYFRFLRELKLADLQYPLAFSFSEFQKQILQNEILAIPKIEETEIPIWLTNVKSILVDLVGFNDGQYYDILVANAYGRQLTEEVRPLTEKQKENIKNYWGNGEIAKILLRKNQKVAELDKFKSPLVINDVSSITPERVIETILSKHKGKVILIDLWATWCAPCLEAMQRFRPAKAAFQDKDVVFVYLTNHSSNLKLWEEKIKGIGSQQYYLDNKQWEYIMTKFDFEYIPSYLLYDKKGTLNNKFSAFPENDEVKKMLNDLL